MTPTTIEAAARLIAETRQRGELLTELPADLTPPTMDAAYLIQDRFRMIWSATASKAVAGWKAGATAEAVQVKFGVGQPFAGPFFANDVYASPAIIAAAKFPHLCLESEFAFVFGRALEPRNTPYTRSELLDAIDAIVPAFELVGPRFDSLLFGRAPTAAADCALNAAFVFGQPVRDWRGLDLAAHDVVLSIDGTERVRGKGANVLGDPLNSLEWTVNHLSGRAIGIAAGQIISTGTTTGIVYVEPEQTAVADFGRLGRVEMRFTGLAHALNVRPA